MLIPISLYLAGVISIIIEFFVPTAGILGVFGGGIIVYSVIFVYREFGSLYGIVFMLVALITAPGLFFFYFKVFPKSFVGKRLILSKYQSIESGYGTTPERKFPEIGERGRCISALRPSGTVSFDAGKFSVVTSGEFIENGAAVEVANVEGNRIVVRKLSTHSTSKENRL